MLAVDDYFQLNKKLAELEQVFIDRDALEACLSIEDYELYYSLAVPTANSDTVLVA